MAITPLPTPPTRQDPVNFADRADTFLAALPTFADEVNADLGTVADNFEDIQTVSTNISNVNTVVANLTTINNVSANITDIVTVADNETNIDTVAANITNINAAVADLPALSAKVSKTGDTMTGPLSVPAGASGAQVPQAQEIPGLLGITGSILFFARNTAPTGWLKANGAAVSRASYAALFSAIGTTFGAGDGSTTFNLPDLRGEFLRGWDDGRGVDSGRGFGSAQAGEIQAHTHEKAAAYGNPAATFSDSSVWSRVGTADPTSSIRTGSTGGTETRPRNLALLACIKF